ncbi:DUF4124 domain-containing protein [Thermodesulfobacteriota bacterium]
MRYFIIFALAFILSMGPPAVFAQAVYTWTDENGNLHFTNRPPRGDANILKVDEFKAGQNKNEISAAAGQQKEDGHERLKERLKSEEEAEESRVSRKRANEAQERANEAIEKAEKIREEADAYIEKLGPKSKKRKSLRYKMRKEVDKARKAGLEAQELQNIAIEAEAEARKLENNLEQNERPQER